MNFVKWLAKRGATGGIARSQFAMFQRMKRKNPELSESEIAEHLFAHRFSTIGPVRKERARLQAYVNENSPPSTLREVCYAIAEVEMDISPLNIEQYDLIIVVIDEELERLGYVEEGPL